MLRRLMIVTAAVGLAASVTVLGTLTASAAKVQDSISGYTVTCDGTWTDPGTGEVHEVYGVTVTFTHAGPRELRIYETAGAGYIDSDHGWFQGQGTDTFPGSLAGGLSGQSVSFDLFVLKADRRTHSLIPTASAQTGTYSC
jgi:hypothetical protein